MFSSRKGEAELKTQGVVEAAQDPESNVTSEDAEKKMVEESKKAGGMAMQFDPDATPEEKAAQARARVPEGFHREKEPQAVAILSDADGGAKADYDLPPPSKEGVIATPPTPTTPGGRPQANGNVGEDLRWSRNRTGWAPRFGEGDPADNEGPSLLDHETWLEGQLDDKWFGDWYYNAGIMIFACLSTYVMTLLGGGLIAIFVILAFCATYYRTSLRRVRRNFRDDISREMAKAKLETDHESLEWINSFLVKFWPIYAPVLCDTIINSVDQVLSTSTPAFLDSLRMKTFVLGTKPPRLEHVKTYPKAEDDTVLMDWKFSFNPNDTIDMTARQLRNKINPKVVLEVRIGKGLVSKGLDVIVEDFAFSGTMRVKVKLQIPFPHIEKVEVCFLGRPTIDYVCKPLGGDTFGFDINFVPGLESFIQEQIHGNLQPIMYDPNVFPVEIAKMLAGNPVDQAIGVVQVTIHNGQGLKNSDKFSGVPDPYATISINNRDVVGKTKTMHENSNPIWHQTFNIIVTSLKDSLTMAVFDYNEYRKDKELGIANFALDRLEEDYEHENVQLEVMGGGRARGALLCDVRFFPVLEAAKLPDGTVGEVPESNTGICKFTVEQAKELDGSKSLIGQLNPYAVLLLNGKEIHTSAKLKRTNNPIWPNASKEFLITDRKTAKLGVAIKDDRDLSSDPILGTYQIRLNDLIELSDKGQEWFNLAGTKAGRAKMMLQWKPVALKGGVGGGGYITPIGVMRLHFINARDLRNMETVGKSDPYVRVLLSGLQKGRTVTWNNNLNPDFDEVLYIPMHAAREKLTLEVMDQEANGRDRSLGLLELNASDYISQDESGEYLVHDEKKQRSDPLRVGGKGAPKGTLNYTCSFFPCYNVVDPEEEEKEKEADPRRVSGSGSRDATPRASVDSNSASKTRSDRSGTISSLSKGRPSSEMKRLLADGEKEQDEGEQIKEPPKIKIGADDLQHYESGLLVFRIIDAELATTGCSVEVVMDDHSFPSYRSPKAKSRSTTFNDTGDAMVRELEFSKITLRLREKEHEGEEVIAKVTGDTLDVLRRGLYQTIPFTLRDSAGRESRVTAYLKYLPVKMQLDPSESINNQGKLRIDILDAADLPAADRNGYSDPYCKFILNGKQTYKSDTQKKTLHPAWNERFETNIPSRTGANFKVEVWDWDRGDKDDLLGTAAINLEVLDPMEPQEITLNLDGKSGAIRLRMMFSPAYVMRTSQGTSTFSGTFATPGKVIGAPVKGVGKVGTFVGGNVVRGASFMTRGFRSKKSAGNSSDLRESQSPEASPAQTSHVIDSRPPSSAPRIITTDGEAPSTPTHSRQRSDGLDSTAPTTGGSEIGVATLSIVSASGFEGGSVRVFIKQNLTTSRGTSAKEVHKTKSVKATPETDLSFGEHESFKVPCASDATFVIQVKDTHTFGSDEDLGEGTFSVADVKGSTGETKIIHVGSGAVTVSANWTATDVGSVYTTGGSGNKLRKSFLGGRSPRTPSSPEATSGGDA